MSDPESRQQLLTTGDTLYAGAVVVVGTSCEVAHTVEEGS